MKKITFLFLLFTITNTFGQVTNMGEPLSWKVDQLSPVSPVEMKPIDFKVMEAEDAINDQKRDIPWRFGKELPVLLNTQNSGVWDVLKNGNRIWRLNIISPGAKTLNFVFNDFYLPSGAKLYLYNDEKTDILGAYTSSQNREDKQLGTWFVEGDNIWIEYYEPSSQAGLGSLQVSKVVHGYRSVSRSAAERGLNNSGDCNQDIDCSVGADFDSLKEALKRSVALFILGGSACSGTLINNTDNNNAPYFLTASHCDNGNTGEWAFRFNWVSPNPSCGTTTNSTNITSNHTVSGATKLAENHKSDFLLVNIDANLPTSWNLVWAGWNRSATEVPDFTVGIHHPAGDIMKVSRDNQSPTRATIHFEIPETSVWRVAEWDLGVTEGGSSGSALFDQNGRIVGQLAGGASACEGIHNNGQPDFYGRFDTSWDYGTTNSTRLSNWLDPKGTGVTSTDILNTPDFQYFGDLRVYPNPVSSALYIENNNSSNLEYQIYSLTGQLIQENKLSFSSNVIDMSQLSEGIYFLKLTDKNSDGSLIKRIAVKK